MKLEDRYVQETKDRRILTMHAKPPLTMIFSCITTQLLKAGTNIVCPVSSRRDHTSQTYMSTTRIEENERQTVECDDTYTAYDEHWNVRDCEGSTEDELHGVSLVPYDVETKCDIALCG